MITPGPNGLQIAAPASHLSTSQTVLGGFKTAVIYLIEVRNRRQLAEFVHFPFRLYSQERCWVPPLIVDEFSTLRSDKNPAFEHCETRYWLVRKSGKVAGRIGAIINHQHEVKWGQRYVRLWWAEYEDDLEVSSALFAAVEDWARNTGATAVHGPLGFSDMDRQGLLVDGFAHTASLTGTYNFAYYQSHFERLGYEKDVDWVQLEASIPRETPAAVRRIAERARLSTGLSTPRLSRRELRRIAPDVLKLMNRSYLHLYSYVDLTPRQIEAYCEQYFGFIDPAFVSVALDQGGRVVAFAITLPWLSEALKASRGRLFPFGFIHLKRALSKNNRAELCSVGCDPAYARKGVYAMLADDLNMSLAKRGIESAETSLMLEHNDSVLGLWKYYGAQVTKRKRCYIKRTL